MRTSSRVDVSRRERRDVDWVSLAGTVDNQEEMEPATWWTRVAIVVGGGVNIGTKRVKVKEIW
jgi:hypothetical protein